VIEVVVPRETNRAGKLFSPFFVISLILFGTVIWGFWQSYFWPLMTFSAERSWLIHVHATVFVGWMVLLVAQALAVSLGNRQFHRRFGVAGMGFAVLVFIVGLIVSVEVPAAGARAGDFPLEIAGLVAVYLVTDMLIFGALMVAAMADRAQPAFHKRLIVCATVALTTAAIGRVLPAGSSRMTCSHNFLLQEASGSSWSHRGSKSLWGRVSTERNWPRLCENVLVSILRTPTWCGEADEAIH
jgi:hypothetical protein